jgi:hypothetical protein
MTTEELKECIRIFSTMKCGTEAAPAFCEICDELDRRDKETQRLRAALQAAVNSCHGCEGKGYEEEYTADYKAMTREPCGWCMSLRDVLEG